MNNIYIIMANKIVKYFKNPEEINEKIKYIKEKIYQVLIVFQKF